MIKLTLKNGNPVYLNVDKILAIGDTSLTGPLVVDVRETKPQILCAIALYKATHGRSC